MKFGQVPSEVPVRRDLGLLAPFFRERVERVLLDLAGGLTLDGMVGSVRYEDTQGSQVLETSRSVRRMLAVDRCPNGRLWSPVG